VLTSIVYVGRGALPECLCIALSTYVTRATISVIVYLIGSLEYRIIAVFCVFLFSSGDCGIKRGLEWVCDSGDWDETLYTRCD
jgi:hypothetical protein